MANPTVRGLVLREVNYRDSDKMLTILTAERGKISAAARGARGKNSRLKAGTQVLTCSDFVMYEQQGRYTVDTADPVEFFIGLRADIVSLSLGAYIAEVLECVAAEDVRSDSLLADGLNCLYALSKNLRPHAIIKAAFELRTAALCGFAPDMDSCTHCGDIDPSYPALDIHNGALTCKTCNPGAVELDAPTLAAMRHLLTAPSRKMFAFALPSDASLLSRAAERYMLTHLDRRFATLEFYHGIL